MTEELERLEDRAKELDKQRTSTISAIQYINERNRQKNIVDIERAILEVSAEVMTQEGYWGRAYVWKLQFWEGVTPGLKRWLAQFAILSIPLAVLKDLKENNLLVVLLMKDSLQCKVT